MRMSRFDFQVRLERLWYNPMRTPPIGLRLLSGIYGILTKLRCTLYRRGIFKVWAMPVPVIVVGNISVGGTGKTPLTIALVEALRVRGWKPGVISRGYGASSEDPVLVDENARPSMVGDEPYLIHQRTGAPVAVGRDRVAVARLLLAVAKPDVLIADDGLQHYALFRNVEICVIDGERRFGNMQLLPAGPLRESPSRLVNIEFRVCNGPNSAVDEVPMRLRGDNAVALSDATLRQPLHTFVGQRVHAVAAIGNPQRFFARLRNQGIDLIEHVFADHHAYQAADLDFADELPILMTEKDAVKCVSFARSNLWYVPVCAELPEEFFDAIAAKLRAG